MTFPVRTALGLLLFAAGASLGSLAWPANGLRASYYSNPTRSGPPVVQTIDPEASTGILENGTAGGWSSFSVEWIGFIRVAAGGPHVFSTISDDGSELEVGDIVVVRNGGIHGPEERSGTIDLPAGIHPIRIRYEQHGGGYALQVRVARAGEQAHTISRGALFPDPISPLEYRLRSAAPLVTGPLLIGLWWWLAPVLRPRRRMRATTSAWKALDRTGVAVAAIIVVGVVSRTLMMLGSTGILWPDSDIFLETVESIRAGRYLEHDPFRTLLYPYFLYAFLRWGSAPWIGTLIVATQHALGIAASLCFYFAGRRAVGRRSALAGALLFNLHTIELFYEASILTESLFVFGFSVTLLTILWFGESPSPARAVVVGLSCAVLTLIRPVAQWYPVAPIALAVAVTTTWRRRALMAAAIALVYAAVMLPWMAVNQREFGFFGVALGRGLGLFARVFEVDRTPPSAATRYPDVKRALDFALDKGFGPANYVRDDLDRNWGYSMAQTDAAMFGYSLEAIRERPATFALNTARNWGRQLGGVLGGARVCASAHGPHLCSGRTQGYSRAPFVNAPQRDGERVRAWLVAFVRHGYVRMPVVVALAAFGVVAYFAGRPAAWRAGALMGLSIAYYTFIPAVSQWPQDRYRLPVDALLFMFAAVGIGALAGSLGPQAQREA